MSGTTPSSTDATQTTTEITTKPIDGSVTETTPAPKPTGDGLAAALDAAATPPKPDDATPPKPTDKPAAAPEKYEAWATPEGYELDAGLVEEATPIFKELGLTQEATQKLVDFYAKHSIKSAEDFYAASAKAYQDMRAGWRQDMLNDAELGKLVDDQGLHGPKSPLVSTVLRAVEGLQDPKLTADFKEAMNLTGAGDNPAFVKVLYALAKQVTEGTSYVNGGVPKPESKRPSAAAAMYPNLPSEADRK